MMQGINTWLWPYLNISMYNALNKVCIAYGAIMLTAHTLVYTLLVHFLFEHTTKIEESIGSGYDQWEAE